MAKVESEIISENTPLHALLLSVGSGPGIIETYLSRIRKDIRVITLDQNDNMISRTPLFLHPVLANGQHLPFSSYSFNVVVCITSLEFMDYPEQTIEEIVHVLKKDGILLALLLNPDSPYVQEKMHRSNSYIGSHLKQQNLDLIMDAMSQRFRTIISEIDLNKDHHEKNENIHPIMSRLKIVKAVK